MDHALDGGNYVDLIYLDFQKAFDSVLHKHLSIKSKLASFGVQGKLLKWIENFLTDTQQKVVINLVFLQLSVESCLLFIMFINDLTTICYY